MTKHKGLSIPPQGGYQELAVCFYQPEEAGWGPSGTNPIIAKPVCAPTKIKAISEEQAIKIMTLRLQKLLSDPLLTEKGVYNEERIVSDILAATHRTNERTQPARRKR